MTNNKGEFDLIRKYFSPLSADVPGADLLKDDVASLKISEGLVPVVTLDTLVSGVHFFPNDPPRLIAQKLLRVSLSDLAASGALPIGYFLSLSLPADIDEGWIAEFSRGLSEDQERYQVFLHGGDTTRTIGPISLSLTAIGEAPENSIVRRSGASPGDRIFVTGTIGDAAIGLRLINDLGFKEALDIAPFLVDRYLRPLPRVELGPLLRDRATAAIDISDGLAGDAAHIAEESNVSMIIDCDSIPVSSPAKRQLKERPDYINQVIAGGDDYEILFCAPSSVGSWIQKECSSIGVDICEIGFVTEGRNEPVVLRERGETKVFKGKSWQHF